MCAVSATNFSHSCFSLLLINNIHVHWINWTFWGMLVTRITRVLGVLHFDTRYMVGDCWLHRRKTFRKEFKKLKNLFKSDINENARKRWTENRCRWMQMPECPSPREIKSTTPNHRSDHYVSIFTHEIIYVNCKCKPDKNWCIAYYCFEVF